MSIDKRYNLDYLEFVFNYVNKPIGELIKTGSIVNKKSMIYGDISKYIIDDFIEVRISPPRGVVEGRIYVKVLNRNLYGDELLESILKIKELETTLEFLYINRIDFCIDFKGLDILNKIDFNSLNKYNKPNINGINGGDVKTIYFNSIHIDKHKPRNSYKKQRVSATLYNKSGLISKHEEYKMDYINPDGDELMRLEMRLIRTPQYTKERHLLDLLGYYIFYDPIYFIENKKLIMDFIFYYYDKLWSIDVGDLNFNFNYINPDHSNFNDISKFVDNFNGVRMDFNKRNNEVKKIRRTHSKTIINKRLWNKKVNLLIELGGGKWRDNISDPFIISLLDKVNIVNEIDFEYVRSRGDIFIDDIDIFNEIYLYIRNRYKIIKPTLVDEIDKIDSDKLLDIFDHG